MNASQPFRACIVVPLSPYIAEWTKIIEEAAERASLPVIRWDGEAQAFPDEDCVVLTERVSSALLAYATHFAVVAGYPSPEQGGLDHRIVSQRLAETYDLLATDTLVIRASDLGVAAKSTVYARLNLSVNSTLPAPPEQQYPGSLALYASGPPAIGTSASFPLEVFSFDDRHATPERSRYDLELTGRARYLVFGPYSWLTHGTWAVTVTFAVDQDAATRGIRLEWGGVDSFSQFSFSTGEPGRFTAMVEHDFDAASVIELRIVLADAALAGHFILEDVFVQRVR